MNTYAELHQWFHGITLQTYSKLDSAMNVKDIDERRSLALRAREAARILNYVAEGLELLDHA